MERLTIVLALVTPSWCLLHPITEAQDRLIVNRVLLDPKLQEPANKVRENYVTLCWLTRHYGGTMLHCNMCCSTLYCLHVAKADLPELAAAPTTRPASFSLKNGHGVKTSSEALIVYKDVSMTWGPSCGRSHN